MTMSMNNRKFGCWIENCHEELMTIELSAKTYMDSFLSKRKSPSKVHDILNIQSKGGYRIGK